MGNVLLRRLALALVLALVLAGTVAGSAGAQPPTDVVPGEILVKFKSGTPAQAVADAHRQNGGQIKDAIPEIEVQVVRVPAGQETARVAAYAHNPNVLFAEVNGLYYAVKRPTPTPPTDQYPNDPLVGQQWQYDSIDAFEAWGVTQGSDAVAIAILDTGIDQSHEDLMGKVVNNVNFSNSRTVDDKYGHGTHVAGSAAAKTNNGVGVAGTCPSCVLYNVKVLGDTGGGSWDAIARGIDWAADNGAKVVSMSLGGSYDSSTVKTAVDYAWSKGVVITAAAGNDGASTPFYPAYYANVIAVAATDATDAKASWSNFGSWVDVAAPGVDILSTAPDHTNRIWRTGVKYGTISGTSMATPHVAGVAGLVWSQVSAGKLCTAAPSNQVNACVRSRIEGKADAIDGTGTYWTFSRINAYRSVAEP